MHPPCYIPFDPRVYTPCRFALSSFLLRFVPDVLLFGFSSLKRAATSSSLLTSPNIFLSITSSILAVAFSASSVLPAACPRYCKLLSWSTFSSTSYRSSNTVLRCVWSAFFFSASSSYSCRSTYEIVCLRVLYRSCTALRISLKIAVTSDLLEAARSLNTAL